MKRGALLLMTITSAGAWVLTVTLVYLLLSGSFAERICQTDCVQMVATGALVAAVIGFLLSMLAILYRWQHNMVCAPLAAISTAALLLIFGTTTVIGVAFS